jgi:signal recognition particle receptor subunit beta
MHHASAKPMCRKSHRTKYDDDVIADDAKNELALKIVYWGVGLCGKTSNLQYVWRRTPPELRTEIDSIATATGRTMSFSIVPRTLAPIDGRAIRIWLWCAPGAVFYDASRASLLAGVDGVVFVADSQAERIEANVESFEDLERTLADREGRRLVEDLPFVLQYNKRDLPNAMSIDELDRALARRDAPRFEAVASRGEGVFHTLKACAQRIHERASVK